MSNIATTISQSRKLVELGLDPKTADMFWKHSASLGNIDINGKINVSYHDNLFVGKYDGAIPAWSLPGLLELMPKPDLYRETADLWVCVAFFKEGSIRGYGETAIEAACDNITKMFRCGYLKKKGGDQ